MIIAMLAGIFRTTCDTQAPASPQPSIAIGALARADAYLHRGDQHSAIKDYGLTIADCTQAIRLKPRR